MGDRLDGLHTLVLLSGVKLGGLGADMNAADKLRKRNSRALKKAKPLFLVGTDSTESGSCAENPKVHTKTP
jgi:hypothetical protein